MSIPLRTTIKQIILIGGTVAFIVWLAYEMSKRYPLLPTHSSPTEELQVIFN